MFFVKSKNKAVRASALYLIIVIALIIGIISAALVSSAYFYRLQHQKNQRYFLLQQNLESAINIILNNHAGHDNKVISLFNRGEDSVLIKQTPWGVYDTGTAVAFIANDTLYRTFFYANEIDSTKWAALYLANNHRPLGLSGYTVVTGNVFIPDRNTQTTNAENKFYSGPTKLIDGKINKSEAMLPGIDKDRLTILQKLFAFKTTIDTLSILKDSITNSFLHPVKIIYLGKHIATLKHVLLSNNVIIRSDTTIYIDSTAKLNNIIICARSIFVSSGFYGNCQLFSSDSLVVRKRCNFTYPSVIGLLNFAMDKTHLSGIKIGSNNIISGIIFNHQFSENKKVSEFDINNLINIGKQNIINGQVYAETNLSLGDSCKVNGSIFVKRLFKITPFSVFENYLIDEQLNENKLSKYYLTSKLLPAAAQKQKILKWLESN